MKLDKTCAHAWGIVRVYSRFGRCQRCGVVMEWKSTEKGGYWNYIVHEDKQASGVNSKQAAIDKQPSGDIFQGVLFDDSSGMHHQDA